LCLLSEESVYSKLNVILIKNNSFVLTLNELSPTYRTENWFGSNKNRHELINVKLRCPLYSWTQSNEHCNRMKCPVPEWDIT
ncbi:Uncharacterized protein FWK35_00017724, partial [Aphis craccivora]